VDTRIKSAQDDLKSLDGGTTWTVLRDSRHPASDPVRVPQRGEDISRIISVRGRAMRKRANITRHTAEELAAMEARGEDRTDWGAVVAKSEKELAADMTGDPAWDDVPADWVTRAAHAATALIRRPGENKRQVTMRFDADVLEFFKRAGRGWQGRMNAVLRSFMEQQCHRR
jgi:uncharacterized protein (DUF4415 family)